MTKILFIAYSHDNEEHKAWVKKFANDLGSSGHFEVLLDQNQPRGSSLSRFMEIGLEKADKVLIIGTPKYKQKSESSSGTAFEESIISSQLMHDIDATKFYPILRSGTFETSFPPILQGRIGDDLSDDSVYEIKLKTIINSILDEPPLPSILKNSSRKEHPDRQYIAIVDLSQGVLYETYFGRPTGKIEGIGLDLQITNKMKEVRYFNCPTFQLSHPIVETNDSFSFLNSIVPISFPVRLEYGQQVSVSYKLEPGLIDKFISVLGEDLNTTIKAIVTTTLGEKCESIPLKIAEIIENSKYVKKQQLLI